jgi:TonB family protein
MTGRSPFSILIIALCFSSILCKGQESFPIQDDEYSKIFVRADEMPQFPGGDSAMMKFISTNTFYPPIARENRIQGTIEIYFVVDTDGAVIDPKIHKGGLGGNCEQEALRVIASMPKWKPGKIKGHKVKVLRTVPVTFNLMTTPDYKAIPNPKERQSNAYNKGVAYLQNGNYEEAVKEFDKALSLLETDVDAYFNRGIAKFRMRDTLQACRDWSAAAHFRDTSVYKMIDKYCSGVIVYKGDSVPVAKARIRDTSNVYDVVDVMPEFSGGQAAMMQFISENTRYPADAKKKGIQGRVYVSFIITSSGEVTDPIILRGVGGGLDEESLRVVMLMPRWTPGRLNGLPVSVKCNMPINFTLK